MELKINQEFKHLIPPLAPDEYKMLESSIINEGCRESIVLWNDTIVDGHNRYEICTTNNVEFKISDIDFTDEDAAKIWIINNQMGRRNITDWVKFELSTKKKDILLKQGREKQKEEGKLYGRGNTKDEKVLSIIDTTFEEETHSTRKIIAEDIGKSTGWVGMAEVVDKNATEEIKEKLRKNETTVNKAYKDIKEGIKERSKTEKAKSITEKEYKTFEGIINGDCLDHISEIEDKSIDCLITDPPYGADIQFNKYKNDFSRKIENDKDVFTALDLLDKVLKSSSSKLKESAHIYIFCTWKVYPEFKNVIENYHTIKNVIVWNKKLMGMGDIKYNYADSYELIIFAGGQREFVKRPSNIIELRFDDERYHNTQKPVALLEQLIENSTDPGDLIFDPFLGSGSTAVAAIQKKRRIIGYEIDQQNYKITLKRLQDVD